MKIVMMDEKMNDDGWIDDGGACLSIESFPPKLCRNGTQRLSRFRKFAPKQKTRQNGCWRALAFCCGSVFCVFSVLLSHSSIQGEYILRFSPYREFVAMSL